MQNVKRDILMTVFLSSALIVTLQFAATKLPTYLWIPLAAFGIGSFFAYVYRFFVKIESMVWQQQLFSVVQKMSTPVLITNAEHKITYVNDNFNRLSIAALLPQCDYFYNVLDALEQDSVQHKEILNGLCTKIKMRFSWEESTFEWRLAPLFSASGKRAGMLIECLRQKEEGDIDMQRYHPIPVAVKMPETKMPEIKMVEEKNPFSLDKLPEDEILSQAFTQSAHPFMIVNANQVIQKANKMMIKLLSDPSEENVHPENVENKSLISVMMEACPKVSMRCMDALSSGKIETFIAEHKDKICDWVITPIQSHGEILGHMIEIAYPSRQEYKCFQESAQRSHDKQHHVEKELLQFTRGITQLNLYPKEGPAILGNCRPENFKHVLLKNTSKIVHQLGSSMQKCYQELDHLKKLVNSGLFADRKIPKPKVEQLSEVVMENKENMKRAEDVLLEEWSHSIQKAR